MPKKKKQGQPNKYEQTGITISPIEEDANELQESKYEEENQKNEIAWAINNGGTDNLMVKGKQKEKDYISIAITGKDDTHLFIVYMSINLPSYQDRMYIEISDK